MPSLDFLPHLGYTHLAMLQKLNHLVNRIRGLSEEYLRLRSDHETICKELETVREENRRLTAERDALETAVATDASGAASILSEDLKTMARELRSL